jgi:hypothetical protein
VHLFLYCPFALRVWDQICFWLRLDFNLPHSCISLLNFFAAAFVSKLIRQGLVLIWSSVIWALWRQRNRIIFENGNSDFNSVVDEIKIVSWKWWIGRLKSPTSLLYEWLQEPLLCMSRVGASATS